MEEIKKAIIFGVAGQDGAYLAKLLLEEGYEVTGAGRSFSRDLWRLRALGLCGHTFLKLVECDVTDADACGDLLLKFQPDEVYNLASQSSVALSFEKPVQSAFSNGMGACTLFEAIRKNAPEARLFQASSGDMFGERGCEELKNEFSPFFPKSPYAVAKLFAHQMAGCFRQSYGLHFSCGIMFNHESPLRGRGFVTKKIADAVARISLGEDEVLELGNMNASRDWGYAPEYVGAMRRIIDQPFADDFVLATGRLASVRDFAAGCFSAVGIGLAWEGTGVAEKGYDKKTGKLLISVNPDFYRPIETSSFGGDAAKASIVLGWKAHTGTEDLCRILVEDAINAETGNGSFDAHTVCPMGLREENI